MTMNEQTKTPNLPVQEFRHEHEGGSDREKADEEPHNSFSNPAAILKKVGGVGEGDAPEFALVSREFPDSDEEQGEEDDENEAVNSFSNPASALMKFGTVTEGDVPELFDVQEVIVNPKWNKPQPKK